MHSSSGGWMTILVQNKHLLNLSLEQEVTVIILPTDISQYTLCQACILHRSQTQYCWWLMACFQHLHLTTLHFFFWGKKFSLTVALLPIILWLNLWIFVFLFCNNLVKQINLEKAFWFIQLKKNYLTAANSERLNYYCYCQVINYMAPK